MKPEKTSVRQIVAHRKYVLAVLCAVVAVHLAALAAFTSGFLLTRPVLLDLSTNRSTSVPPFQRAVILVVDALRHDFVAPPPSHSQELQDSQDQPYLGHFPVHSISSDPEHSFTLQFMADPPTTTLQRLKGLTTGSLPAFIDAGSNFAGFKIEEDNWVSQAAHNLGPVAFVGDDTWDALFGHEFATNLPYPSLNVRDLDTVDNGVKQHLPQLVANTSNRIVIGHMLGVDHVGHRYGPAHPAMATKLDETFAFVRDVAAQIDDDTVLVVMGDHGMDATGNHGGDSPDELTAALWVYAKRPMFTPNDLPKVNSQKVNQIDFVPTLCGWLGLAVPYNSLGFPIRQGFQPRVWTDVVQATNEQLKTYATRVMPAAMQEVLAEVGDKDVAAFQERMLAKYHAAWAQFDLGSMVWGIGLEVGACLFAALLYSQLSVALLASVSRCITVGACFGSGIGVCLGVLNLWRRAYLPFVLSMARWAALGTLLAGSIPLLRAFRPVRPSAASWFALVLLITSSLTSFSNSFVIWENKIVLYLVGTGAAGLVVASARLNPGAAGLATTYAVLLLVLARLASSWVLCREETASRCQSTFFEFGTSLVPAWTLPALGVSAALFPYYLARFWAIGRSNVGVADVMLKMTGLAMALTVAYWALDGAEARGWLDSTAFGLQSAKLLIGRLNLLMGALGVFIWWRGNLPIEIVLGKNGMPEKIAGYNNVFGSYGLLAVVAVFWTLTVANKPPAGLALLALLYSCLVLLDLLSLTGLQATLLGPVLLDLLANGYFYYTGHQATIASIQWDTAFIAARTVKFPWSPITVFLNSFGPFVLCGLVSVFVPLWRRTPFKDPQKPVAVMGRAAAGALLVAGVRTTSALVAALVLRRHLMTWKIFAPRFMFGAMVQLAGDLACVGGVVLGGHTVKVVAELFG